MPSLSQNPLPFSLLPSPLSKSEILRLYSIVRVAMETTKTSNFTCQSKSFISIFFTCQVSACELQPISCNNLANDTESQTAKTVLSHLKPSLKKVFSVRPRPLHFFVSAFLFLFYFIGNYGKKQKQKPTGVAFNLN